MASEGRDEPQPLHGDVQAPGGVAKASHGAAGTHMKSGVVTAVEGTTVHVELGPKVRGVLPLDEFDDPPAVGASFEFELQSIQDGVWRLSRREARLAAAWKALKKGATVAARVIGLNSGGLETKIGPLSAFVPASELANHRVEDLAGFVGQDLQCEVMELSRRRKRIVLSRKAVLRREQRMMRQEILDSLMEGAVVRGTVERIQPFGAFVDLGGGLTGLLHVSNVAHGRVEDPATVLSPGQSLELKVLEVSDGGKRIGLGLKQLLQDPWERLADVAREGDVVDGTVLRVAEFGAFVQVAPGIEGLLHKSQMSNGRGDGALPKSGDVVKVRVKSIDRKDRKLSLSRLTEGGALLGTPEAEREATAPPPPRLPPAQPAVTNLGDLLRAAMARKNDPAR